MDKHHPDCGYLSITDKEYSSYYENNRKERGRFHYANPIA